MKFSRQRIQHIIFIVDLIICFISAFFTLYIRNFEIPTFALILEHLKQFPLMIVTWVFLMYLLNLYSIDKYIPIEKLFLRLLVIGIFSTLVGFTSFYLFSKNTTSKAIVVIYNTLIFVFFVLWHGIIKLFFSKFVCSKVLFIGFNKNVEELITDLDTRCYGKFKNCGIFDETFKDNTISNLEELKVLIEKENIRIFVISTSYQMTPELTGIMFSALENGATFYNLPDFYELIKRRIPLGAINEGWVLNQINLSGKLLYNFVKRTIDITVAALLLVCSLPFWPIFALIIKCESKGPVFFIQTRTGIHGKNFNLLKFRTMRTENNSYAYTTANDNRITKFGNFMRKCRIDELPQMINVLNGSMSLIGPRPERPEYITELEKVIPYYRQRLIVKPGITGWDQVSGEYHSPSVEDTYKKLQNDLYYIKNRCISLDLSITVKTIGTIFTREGI